MLKILIVDDEMLVRIGIKSTLNWEKHGFTVVAEASNGQDALEKIEIYMPDIILTDIRMPIMDGIELLKEIHRRGLPVESVVMSCYNEFELVRSAMQCGASDYLLKLSLTSEELLEVLEHIKKKIQSRSEQTISMSLFDQSDLYERLVHAIWTPSSTPERLEKLAHAIRLHANFKQAAILLLISDPPFDCRRLEYTPVDEQTVQMAHNLLRDYLLGQAYGDIVTLDPDACDFLVVLVPNTDAWGIAQTISQKLHDYLKLPLSIGILDHTAYEKERLSHLREHWNTLKNFRFTHGRCCSLSLRTAAIPSPAASKNEISVKDLLSDIHGNADLELLPRAIQQMAEQMATQQMVREDCLRLFLSAFYQVSTLLSIYRGSEKGLIEYCGQNPVESLQRLQFLSDAVAWFSGFAALTSAYLAECEKQWKSDDVLAAISYVHTNFHLPIGLQDVAKRVGISPAYFCTLFKREAGQSFSEFLARLRVNRSKELLEDKSIYIYEIGEQVGYPDPNYFCKVFKKYTGMSPEAYRRSRA